MYFPSSLIIKHLPSNYQRKVTYLYELFRKEISSSEYDSPEYGYSFPFFQQDLPKVEYISKYGQRQLASESKPRLHAGVDLSCPEGTPIHSIADGTVYQNDYQEGGAGNYIVIKHSDGRFSIYMHMRERSKLSQSKSVKKGEIIGYSGNTGGSEGPHLHFQINKAISTYFSTDSEDPCKYFTRLANKLNAGPLA